MDKQDLAEYMRQYQETGNVLLRAKWTMDGARTLAEAAKQVHAFANEIEDRPDDPDPPRLYEDD